MNRWLLSLLLFSGLVWGEHADRVYSPHQDLPLWQEAIHNRQENNEYLFPVDVKEANEFQEALYRFLGSLAEINFGPVKSEPTN